MHNKSGLEGGLSLDTLSSYCDTNPVAASWLAFYDDCEGQVRDIPHFFPNIRSVRGPCCVLPFRDIPHCT